MTLTRISDAWFPYRGRSRPTVRLFCLPFAGAGASSFAPLAPAGRHSRGLCGAVAGERAACRSAASARWRPWLRHSSSRCGNSWIVRTQFSATAWGKHRLGTMSQASRRHPASARRTVCRRRARPSRAEEAPDRGPPHEQFVEELRRLGGTSQAILENSELLDIFLPVLRADFALSESYDYRVQEPLSLPTFAYAGESDALAPSVCRALVRRSRWPLPDAPLRRRPLFVQSSLEAVADSILRDLERWLVSPPSEVESSGT